ncbi:44355_t:CDS:2 [Gigaspora margarita]|uniref:44355_t:CDS:1 n=1 Tax=Gigaspora margarita TaxID=4874 RepID=A0ABN7UA15_GIGMA|nr:44355_t:CDS:2 [Gigaspora margarita]
MYSQQTLCPGCFEQEETRFKEKEAPKQKKPEDQGALSSNTSSQEKRERN